MLQRNRPAHPHPANGQAQVFAPPLAGLQAAWETQRKLFPQEFPAYPGWEFAAGCRPAQTVAGDYYDLFEVAPGRVALALGDVAGKGLGPALIGAGMHALIRWGLPAKAADLAGFLNELNRYLVSATPEEMFTTLFLAILDVETGELRYVNAGHLPPLLFLEKGTAPFQLSTGGTVLGIVPEATFEEGRAVLVPGSLLALFSDGITEARSETGEMFRESRVVEQMGAALFLPAAMAAARLLRSVEHFTGAPEPGDDQSWVIVRRHPLGRAFCNGQA